jgi:diguanylate cyclase (GGDEF)-like protein
MYLTNPATGRPIASFGVERGERLSPGAALGDDPANHVDRAYDERKLVSHSVDTIESGEGSGMGSLLAAPLISEGTALGVLLVQSDRPEPYGEREQLILGTLSGYGAIALANAKALEALARARAMLEEFAYFDPLTSLPNRRKFLDGYRQSIALARREGRGFALLLIDLDRLKVANDTLGHDAGDFLLVQAAAWLKESVRETDIVARVGGDEFAIVLTDIHSIAAVEQVCGRMVAIFESKIAFRGNALATSPSIGIALFPQDGDHGDALYKAADLALFEAKRAGRNTWRWFRPGMAA